MNTQNSEQSPVNSAVNMLLCPPSRPVCVAEMAATYSKAFTGLTGMAVAKNPTHTLGVLYRYPSTALFCNLHLIVYSKNLRALAKMPVDYPYRRNTEALINERVAIVKQSSTIEEAEKKGRFEIPIHESHHLHILFIEENPLLCTCIGVSDGVSDWDGPDRRGDHPGGERAGADPEHPGVEGVGAAVRGSARQPVEVANLAQQHPGQCNV